MTSADDIVIVSALRTPIGALGGALSSVPAYELGQQVVRAVLKQTGVAPASVSEVIMGQVLTAACGQNPARQAGMAAGIPKETPAITINQVCGSGLRAVCMAYQAVQNGDSEIVLAGGQENMSLSPHAMHLRSATKMGNAIMTDTMITDGLWDAFHDIHMGITAENIAEKFSIARSEQDAFALASQQKAVAAMEGGVFQNEIVSITIKKRKGEVQVSEDEYPRKDASMESLEKLRPAFNKEGSVTAGNASGINDGAAVLMVMKRSEAEKRGLAPLAAIRAWAHAGVEPELMGTGPIPASKKALEKAGWQVDELDLVEANEAFAAQALCVNQQMGWDTEKVNVHGGAIALGHPIGASGARVLTTLLHAMQSRDAKKGLATLCIGGGMGIAICVERS